MKGKYCMAKSKIDNKLIDLAIGYVSDWIGNNSSEFVHEVLDNPNANIRFFKDLTVLYGETNENMASAIQELNSLPYFEISKSVVAWTNQTLRT